MGTINDEAARWVVRADSGGLGPEEQRQLEAWLSADARHRGAYTLLRAHWTDLDRLAALRAWRPQSHPSGLQSPKTDVRASVSRRGLLAASLTALALGGGALSWTLLREGAQRYTSGVGELRRIALEDGSVLLLNTASEVRVELGKHQRNIRLISGEALFEVAHDKARPFVVDVKGTALRAVGTTFAVRVQLSQVNVTLTDGAIEVSRPAAALGWLSPSSRAARKRVSATEELIISSAGALQIRTLAPSDANRQLAWREGMVSFDGETLQAAVSEINRYNRRQIVVDDPVLAAKPIVGLFRTNDLDGFAAAAAVALDARAVSDGDLIRIEPKVANSVSLDGQWGQSSDRSSS